MSNNKHVPFQFALNCYLNANRRNSNDIPTLDFYMKQRFDETTHDTIEEVYKNVRNHRLEWVSTRAKSGFSVDSKQMILSNRYMPHFQECLPEIIKPQIKLQEQNKFTTLFKAKRINKNDLSSISYELFAPSKNKMSFVEQAEKDHSELRRNSQRVHHAKPFMRYSKIRQDPKDQPSVIRMSKSIDVPANDENQLAEWVKYKKVEKQYITLLDKEPYKEPIEHQFSVFRGEPFQQTKKRPWLWFRPTKPHDRNKCFGEDVSLSNFDKFY